MPNTFRAPVPKAILFDVDGVLINSLDNHFHSWYTIMGEQGIEVTRRDVALGEGERAEDSMRRFFREKANRVIPDAEIDILIERKRAIYRASRPEPMPAETRASILAFRAAGLRTALVSGSALSNIRSSLNEDDLALFDVKITGDMHLPGKPDPAPYLAALERLGMKAAECWVVENAPFGIRAAKAAGIYTIALTTTLQSEDLPGADHYDASVTAVLQLYQDLITHEGA